MQNEAMPYATASPNADPDRLTVALLSNVHLHVSRMDDGAYYVCALDVDHRLVWQFSGTQKPELAIADDGPAIDGLPAGDSGSALYAYLKVGGNLVCLRGSEGRAAHWSLAKFLGLRTA